MSDTATFSEKTDQALRLSFSGGGFRASFYCLGAYRRLVELGLHQQVTHISSVSGGSVTAAVIMAQLKDGEFTSVKDFDQRVTDPLRRIGQLNLRKEIICHGLRHPTFGEPRSWFSKAFPQVLDQVFFNGMLLADLPRHPEWSCNATCLNTLRRFRFKPTDIYGNMIGTTYDLSEITISFAVAASAAFPILFAPLRFNTSGKVFHDKYGESAYGPPPETLFLADGGIYDNLGSESSLRGGECFIVVDGSAKELPWAQDFQPYFLQKIWRNLVVSMEQIVLLRRRLIYKNDKTIQLLIDRPLAEIREKDLRMNENVQIFPNYQIEHDAEYAELIGGLRTDLDAFHDVEIDMLMWAGAIRMDMAVKAMLSSRVPSTMWSNIPDCPYSNIDRVREILKRGASRSNFTSVHKKLHL